MIKCSRNTENDTTFDNCYNNTSTQHDFYFKITINNCGLNTLRESIKYIFFCNSTDFSTLILYFIFPFTIFSVWSYVILCIIFRLSSFNIRCLNKLWTKNIMLAIYHLQRYYVMDRVH